MLRSPTVARRATGLEQLARVARQRRIGLRIALAVVAVIYVVVPTVLQWVALGAERAEVAGQRTVVTLEPAPEAVAVPGQPSKPLVDFISQRVPERFREYVPAGLAAIAGAGDEMTSRWHAMVGALLRIVVVVLAAVLSVVVGARLGQPYRPRHARTGRVSRIFVP